MFSVGEVKFLCWSLYAKKKEEKSTLAISPKGVCMFMEGIKGK